MPRCAAAAPRRSVRKIISRTRETTSGFAASVRGAKTLGNIASATKLMLSEYPISFSLSLPFSLTLIRVSDNLKLIGHLGQTAKLGGNRAKAVGAEEIDL